jgi:SAM-dependent methyltransferase
MPQPISSGAYDAYAMTYNKGIMDFWEHFPKEFVDSFIAHLPGKQVLVVGSSSGRDALLLKEMGLQVVCLDASQHMVDMTKRLGFESHLTAFDEMSRLDSAFDGVWAYTSLIQIPKEEARDAIITLHSFLKPGGAFAIGVVKDQSNDLVKIAGAETVPDSLQYYTSPELKQMVTPAGFNFVFENEYQPHAAVYLSQLYSKSS